MDILRRYAEENGNGASHLVKMRLIGGGRGVDRFTPPGQGRYSGFYPYHIAIDGEGTVRVSGAYDFEQQRWRNYMAAVGLPSTADSSQRR
eukprot:NODE_20959_length_775_cov_2.058642.p3 GENE.NODE_20959_length_775_cov_2.058642~~NODE_20959_length_775_cov_2.058642.p3  ORF type:complete len:90 (+),score=28.09 NODE_20959_length_775_cov_2.058642:149-418(+)